MKIITIVGARPQFIKAVVVSREIRKKHREILVHTGQHYDQNMSSQFFTELNLPKPDYNLGISGGSHGQMTGKMIISIEDVLVKEKPDWILLYGDTNSTLAGALAGAKMHIPICHVEAGVRTHNLNNPEEINRVCTDHVSSLLLSSTESSRKELITEGLGERAFFVGDTMYDAYLYYVRRIKKHRFVLTDFQGMEISIPEEYYYLTCHREENTYDDNNLYEILVAMNQLDKPTVYPVHPRNRERAQRLIKKYEFNNIIFCDPVGYMESIALVTNAIKVVTDSGGVQREAFFAKKKCVTVLDFVSWPETMEGGRNVLARPDHIDIIEKLNTEQIIDNTLSPFGDGKAATNILKKIEEFAN